jgi:ferredoxin
MKKIRWITRLFLLGTALFFALGGPFPAWTERLIPALSPLVLLSESIAQRSWYAGLFWGLPPLALLILAFFKGRFFCQWLCPLGTLYSLPQKISLKKKVLPVRLNATIFWILIASSLLGVPALLFLDPLSTVNRIGAWAAWGPGLLIPIFLLLSIFQPQAWCTHLCPLGYSFDLANRKTGTKTFNRDRRQFLAGCGIGAGAAVLLPTLGKSQPSESVLPPGATEKFADTCTRCYACVRACPSGIIRTKSGGPFGELFMPELCFDDGVCNESCTQCSQVCPTGAIRLLSEDEKWLRQIGVAKIQKGKCLAWSDQQACMECEDACPYGAIESVDRHGVSCPQVNPELCRGCGACENICPAVRAGKAILVHPLNPQTSIKENS